MKEGVLLIEKFVHNNKRYFYKNTRKKHTFRYTISSEYLSIQISLLNKTL